MMQKSRRFQRRTLAALVGALLVAGVAVFAVSEGPARASLPGSNGAIAFSSSRDGGFNIYRMSSDGFGQMRLTDAPILNFQPSWSPDGKKILFDNREDFSDPGDIWVMNADGSGETNLTKADKADGDPAYGPSGKKIAFVSNRAENQFDVYVMTVGEDGQTTGLTRLTNDPRSDHSPAISPDGKRILFVSNRDGDEDIYLMKLAPEGPRNVPVKLTKNTPPNPGEAPYMHDFSPDWSPDGRRIVFSSDRGGDNEVYTMKATPEGLKNRPVNLSRNPGGDYDPVYSPDGRKIAFSTNRDGNSEIYRMRASDGANPTNLTNNPAADFYPSWQPLP